MQARNAELERQLQLERQEASVRKPLMLRIIQVRTVKEAVEDVLSQAGSRGEATARLLASRLMTYERVAELHRHSEAMKWMRSTSEQIFGPLDSMSYGAKPIFMSDAPAFLQRQRARAAKHLVSEHTGHG